MQPTNYLQEEETLIWVETVDGSQHEVEQDVALFCKLICKEALQKGKGSSRKTPVVLPPQISPSMLKLILDYCRFHQVSGRSNKERKLYDEKFIKLDTKRLCELTSAADSLQMKPLVELTSRALARMIEGKTPEEIRDAFNLPDDLTEEEKIEPLKNTADNLRIRLLNRLYARKRKDLQEKKKLKDIEQANGIDDRSVEDLLCFINGENTDCKSSKGGKSKKKHNRRKKDNAKDEFAESPSANHSIIDGRESYDDDGELDDGLDPVMKERLDREVEDFARRLNLDWPERKRMQDFLSAREEDRHRAIEGGFALLTQCMQQG